MNGYCTLPLGADHPVFAGHFPDRPIVPGALLVEMAVQAIETATHSRVTSIPQTKFLSPALPGDLIELDYVVQAQDLRFEISTAGRKLATGRMTLANPA